MSFPFMNDFVSFLNENNIHYEKRKDGFPNMKYATNRSNYRWFMHDMDAKHEHFKSAKRRIDFSDCIIEPSNDIVSKSLQTKIDPFDCVICMEPISDNICLLKCKHAFCTSCFAQHMRNSGSCPLCRDIVTDKPKKMEPMPRELGATIVQEQMLVRYALRDNMNLSEYILNIYKKYNNDQMPDINFTRDLLMEFQSYGMDVAMNCCQWYDRSI